jgi:hypothetical protein
VAGDGRGSGRELVSLLVQEDEGVLQPVGTVLGALEGEEQGLDTVEEAEEVAAPEGAPTAEERRQDSGNTND